ncbi:MAG: TRAP transporter TatT component family protein [Gammaproteobacteria bacterium]|nr:TRAP transporter TatT component family protein [Gammaproteobacteria bacterium]
MARALRLATIGVAANLAGCASLVGSMAADTLSSAILNQEDPALIDSGVPAYLLLVDGFIHQSPDNEDLLAAGAQIYALYGSRFAIDAASAERLTRKARDYGKRALCLEYEPACEWDRLAYDAFVAELANVDRKQIDYLYAYALGSLSYLDATSEDLSAVAELPWVEAAMQRVLDLDETHESGAVHTYLGIIHSLRPPALGGQPELARAHFERAIDLSEGRDLSIKVEYARYYARLIFDQDLHDRLLREVLASPVTHDGYTLFNVLAQRDAEALLTSSQEYF